MSDQREDSTGRRLKRHAGVTRAVGGIAARMAGNRLMGRTGDQSAQAAAMRAALGNLKGPLMKAAQMLATVPDFLPKEFADELRELQSNAPPMAWPFVRRRMKSELGDEWMQRFEHFDRQASAAASLGQVHRATSPSGQALACKLQYADMGAAVEADLKQLKLIFSLYGAYDKSIDTTEIFTEVAERLREELDYGREAKHLALYRRMLADEPEIHVPDVDVDLSTGRLLSMHWLEGEGIVDWLARDPSLEERNALAVRLFRAWYVPLYQYGVIHGDPHLGNYQVAANDHINLLDFGCIRVFLPRFIGGVFNLFRAQQSGDRDLAREAYRQWGFGEVNDETLDVLNIWAGFVMGPVLSDKVQPIAATNSVEYGSEVAGKVHAELKRLGGVKVPREFVFMDRAAVGLGSVFLRLGAELNWHQLFMELAGDLDVDAVAKRQAEALVAVGLTDH